MHECTVHCWLGQQLRLKKKENTDKTFQSNPNRTFVTHNCDKRYTIHVIMVRKLSFLFLYFVDSPCRSHFKLFEGRTNELRVVFQRKWVVFYHTFSMLQSPNSKPCFNFAIDWRMKDKYVKLLRGRESQE